MNKLKLNTKDESLRDILSNGKNYFVPKFQRDYSWEKEHWTDLWDDLKAIDKGEEDYHYMGYLVLQEMQTNKFKIVDGQQRMTTFSLIILAAVKRLKTLNEEERVKVLIDNFIGSKSIGSLMVTNKLELNRNNDYYYKEAIEGNDIPKRGIKKTVSLMSKAIDYYYKEFKNFTKGEEIGKLIEKIGGSLLFTTIYIGDELNAYKVFETLNARGVQLSSADLLKNYIFSLIDNQQKTPAEELDRLDEKWGKIGSDIGNKKYSDYVLAEWNSRNSLSRKINLFNDIKKKINNKKLAFDYLNILAQNSLIYSGLLNYESDFWKDHSCYLKIKENLRFLNLFGIRQPSSLLLISYQKLPEDFDKILEWLAKLSFRYNVICRGHPGEQEKHYNKICQKIANGNCNIGEIKELLLKFNPSNEKLRQLFLEKTMPTAQSNRKARYILTKIHNYHEKKSKDEQSFTIEHVLPVKPNGEWQDYFGENWKLFNQRLGNMLLVDSSTNKELDQKSFTEKKEILVTKGIKDLDSYDQWDTETINSRQTKLADIALRIWDFQ